MWVWPHVMVVSGMVVVGGVVCWCAGVSDVTGEGGGIKRYRHMGKG